MKLLMEVGTEYEVLTEASETGKKRFTIRGPFMVAEEFNRNRRKYSKHILQREAARYSKNYISENRGFGELDHPPTPQINLKNVSHHIISLVEDGNNFIGTARLVETDAGKTAAALIEAGCKLGVSSRGVGDVERCNEGVIVKENFHLITPADLVADPSAPRAFVQSVMESADWVFLDGKGWTEQFVAQAKKTIRATPRRQIGEAEVKLFEQFMQNLKSQII